MTTMIDRATRDSLAEKLRQLASGAITNFAFEAGGWYSKTDPAISEIAYSLAWPCYSDAEEHRLVGEYALRDGMRRDFARTVLFLKSDCEFRWPKRTGFEGLDHLIARFSFGFIKSTPVERGAVRFWPFWSEAEYRAALRRPPYLCGQRSNSLPPNGPEGTSPATIL